MANEEHVALLRQGVEVWNQWRAAEPDISPNLRNLIHEGENLVGIDLCWTEMTRADFRGSDLSGADFAWANMFQARLDGVTLRGSRFLWANMTAAFLDRSDLREASLNQADLAGARLNGANLRGADLLDARFDRTQLDYTDFTNARIGRTLFTDVDLSTTQGLATVQHDGPSTIGIDTLYRAGGAIPEVFLRGAGVPQNLIDYLPSLLSQPIQFYSCFISHSSKDKLFARRLHDTLQSRGIRCWLDEHQILPGDPIADMIDRGIRLWDKVLLCASENALTSWWVGDEIDKALEKEQELWKRPGEKSYALIPLNLDGHLFKWQDGRASQLRKRLAPDFTGWEADNAKFDAQVERVIRALQLGGREQPPPSRL